MSARAFDFETEQAILAARAMGFSTADIIAAYGHPNAVYALFRRAGVSGVKRPTATPVCLDCGGSNIRLSAPGRRP